METLHLYYYLSMVVIKNQVFCFMHFRPLLFIHIIFSCFSFKGIFGIAESSISFQYRKRISLTRLLRPPPFKRERVCYKLFLLTLPLLLQPERDEYINVPQCSPFSVLALHPPQIIFPSMNSSTFDVKNKTAISQAIWRRQKSVWCARPRRVDSGRNND